MAHTVVTVLLTAVVCAAMCQAVKRCYYCSNNNADINIPGLRRPPADDHCGDPFDADADVDAVDCSTGCYKMKGKKGDKEIIVRGCGTLASRYVSCTEASPQSKDVDFHIKCCNDNKCNGGAALVATKIALIAFLIAMIFST